MSTRPLTLTTRGHAQFTFMTSGHAHVMIFDMSHFYNLQNITVLLSLPKYPSSKRNTFVLNVRQESDEYFRSTVNHPSNIFY